MKKYLTLVFAILLIFMAACGQVKEENSSADGSAEQTTSTPDETEINNEDEGKDQEEAFPSFEGEIGTFNFIGIYANEEMEENEGAYPVEFEGFQVSVIPVLVEIDLNEYGKSEYEGKDKIRAIQLTMEAENTNDFDVDYNGNITVVTSNGEQLSSDAGIMSENPVAQTYLGQVKEVGEFTIPLEDDSEPESIQLIMEPPYKVEDGAVDPINGMIGEEQRVDFNFISKEDIE